MSRRKRVWKKCIESGIAALLLASLLPLSVFAAGTEASLPPFESWPSAIPSIHEKEETLNASEEPAEEEVSTPYVPGQILYVPVFYGTKVINKWVSKEAASLPVVWVGQYPEFPNGCELTALTTALNYYGFSIDKYTMARKYFITKEWHRDFLHYYVGNPADASGLGCFPPAVVKNANAYLETQNTDLHAFDYTNFPFESLLNQVAAGYPVVIWATIGMQEPYYGIRVEADGRDLVWIGQEHCLVLTGYDLGHGVVQVSDPIAGLVEYDINLFKKRYTQLGYKAVIIKSSAEKFAEDSHIRPWPFNDRFLPAEYIVRGCKGFDGVLEAD